jgi:hypothetical protein
MIHERQMQKDNDIILQRKRWTRPRANIVNMAKAYV